MTAELEEKTERLCRLMSAERFDGIVINSQPNFAWLTCGGRNGIDQSRENGAASLLVTSNGKRFVLANNIEMPRILQEELADLDLEAVEFSWQDEKAGSELLFKKVRSIAGDRVAREANVENKLAACRYSLTPAEIERYRSVCSTAGDAVGRAALSVEPGMTEAEIAEVLRHELAVRGLRSVVTLIAADDRIAKFRHPVPTDKRWHEVLLMVTCAERHGMIANLSRMICVGGPGSDLEQRTRAAAAVNATLLARTRPGTSGAELYSAASDAYSAAGFADEIDRHHQGGATGYRTRDWVAHPASREVVQPFQAFAWNPSITGTKIEDTHLIGDDGPEALTMTDHFPAITNVVEGREYKASGILSI